MLLYLIFPLLFIKLQLAKIFLKPRVHSSFSMDRLRIEWLLCRESTSTKGRLLSVGVHDRSFVYQLVIPAVYVDMDATYLCTWLPGNFHNNAEATNHELFDLVILSGVVGYGTNEDAFLELINTYLDANKEIVVIDWNKNKVFHDEKILANYKCSEFKVFGRHLKYKVTAKLS